MKLRNVRQRQAMRYLSREYAAGRWWWFRLSYAAECRADGTTRAAERKSRLETTPLARSPGGV